MTPPARLDAAIALLDAIEAAPNAPADAVANTFFRARRYIGGGDRRWISDLVWNVLRQRLRLDWHLARAGQVPGARTLVLAWLMLGEGRSADAAAGLFSGSRYGPAPLAAGERDLLRRLAGRALVDAAMDEATRLNLPSFLLDGFRARFATTLAAEAAALDLPASLDLRVNLLKAGRDATRAALAAEGFEAANTPYSPWGLRLAARAPVTGAKSFRDGLVEIQDEGSQLIALLVDARPGMRVLDFCAGAGGKTLAMAAAMENRGRLVAADVSASRLDGAVKRLRRAGVHTVERRLIAPGEKWLKRAAGSFDRVLVDAPCTGSGTWRRNPDARFRLRPEALAELVTKQREILGAAAEMVKAGGRLVYATCSLLGSENERQVEAVLGSRPDFRLLPLAALWGTLAPDAPLPCTGRCLALSPAANGTDGFFAAVMVRDEGVPAGGRN
ncbi:MAG: RsmB/NOP family class I SAM-dependent RNA methyltransferase [Acetobacteraceae bacterium]|nr:RsmB/NOP family class I SAM-dependent RNA methyltransferase [Acetobacteraceae bacterium]